MDHKNNNTTLYLLHSLILQASITCSKEVWEWGYLVHVMVELVSSSFQDCVCWKCSQHYLTRRTSPSSTHTHNPHHTHTHNPHHTHTHTQPSPHTHKRTFTLYSSPQTHPFPTLSPRSPTLSPHPPSPLTHPLPSHSPPLTPGMIAAMTRHLKSLRYMRRDHGWIHTLLEEAENERMHLLTAMVLRNPGPIFKASVIGTQGTQLRVCSLRHFFRHH